MNNILKLLILTLFTVYSYLSFSQDSNIKIDTVVEKINLYLNTAFNKKGLIDKATRVQFALKLATDEREKVGKSRDSILRDAEYYLHGLYATSSGDIKHTSATTGVTMYVALKYGAYAAKEMGVDWFEQLMRTDPEKPTSEPGGIFWAYSGLCDGLKIEGKEEVREHSSHNLQLFSCDLYQIARPSPPVQDY